MKSAEEPIHKIYKTGYYNIFIVIKLFAKIHRGTFINVVKLLQHVCYLNTSVICTSATDHLQLLQ